MRKIIFTLFLLLAVVTTRAQTRLDSMLGIWKDKSQSDSARTIAYKNYVQEGFLYSKPDTAFVLLQALLKFGEKQKYPKAVAMAYNQMGLCHYVKSEYPKALNYYQRSLKISVGIGDKSGMASTTNSLGMIYYSQDAIVKALECYQRCLKLCEETGNKIGMGGTLNNIGSIYKDKGDNANALKYYQRSFKLCEETGNKSGMSGALNNFAMIYSDNGDYAKALDFFQRSLKLKEESGNKKGMANTLNNIGSLYKKQGDYTRAMNYFIQSLKIQEEIGDKKGMVNTLKNIGVLYNEKGNYAKALEYCKKALLISQEIESIEYEKFACNCLYNSYKAMGKGNEALMYLEKIQVLNDSLKEEETTAKLQEMEFAKQLFVDSIAQVESDRILEEAHQKEMRKKNLIRNVLIGSSLFLFLLVGGIYSRLSYVRKTKATLQLEKDRSENLLLNILPAEIAAELKANGKAEARNFDTVSILFTDFKDFTRTSEKLSAQELLSEINTCFEAFDAICEKYNIEKIKTIGDSYMGAGGLPLPSDDSVKNTVLAALEMQEIITNGYTVNEVQHKSVFQMRVGVHTGPVVAGIVGVKKFQYDIWGDTVNTASRMESSGEIGKVNISAVTYAILKDDPAFKFESRGKIQAKGKGEIEMYFVSKS